MLLVLTFIAPVKCKQYICIFYSHIVCTRVYAHVMHTHTHTPATPLHWHCMCVCLVLGVPFKLLIPIMGSTLTRSITAEALGDAHEMLAALRASAHAITTTHIPTVEARSDRLLSRAATQQAVYAAGVDDVIVELVGQQGKVGAGMQRGVVTCVKRVDADVDVSVVSGGQLASVEKLCEATLASGDYDAVHVMEMADAVCEYRAVDTTLQMLMWSESDSGMRGVMCAIGKIPLTKCGVDKGACVVRGQGVERYVPSSTKLHGDEHNKVQLVCVSGGGLPVVYLSAGDAGLEFVGDGRCVGECVGCEVAGPGMIEMVYRVEGTGDLQLVVRIFGEVVLVSVIPGICWQDMEVCALNVYICVFVWNRKFYHVSFCTIPCMCVFVLYECVWVGLCVYECW